MLGIEGTDAQTLLILYVAVVQALLLYRLERWVMSLLIGKNLGGFHNRADNILTGHQPQRVLGGRWLYPLLEEAMAEAGIQEV